jgi:biopolymer transport protein ExbD
MDKQIIRTQILMLCAVAFVIGSVWYFAELQKLQNFSQGTYLNLAHVDAHHVKDFKDEYEYCGDDMPIFIFIAANHKTKIRVTEIAMNDIPSEVKLIFQSRHWHKEVFLMPDKDAELGDVIYLYEKLSKPEIGVKVILITSAMKQELAQCPKGAACSLKLNGHTEDSACLGYEIPRIIIPVTR